MTDENMTDDTDEENTEQYFQEAKQPEIMSYEIRATRVFEMDFAEQQLQEMMQQTDTDSPEEAIEQIFLQRETQMVEPEQKLMGADVAVEE